MIHDTIFGVLAILAFTAIPLLIVGGAMRIEQAFTDWRRNHRRRPR